MNKELQCVNQIGPTCATSNMQLIIKECLLALVTLMNGCQKSSLVPTLMERFDFHLPSLHIPWAQAVLGLFASYAPSLKA